MFWILPDRICPVPLRCLRLRGDHIRRKINGAPEEYYSRWKHFELVGRGAARSLAKCLHDGDEALRAHAMILETLRYGASTSFDQNAAHVFRLADAIIGMKFQISARFLQFFLLHASTGFKDFIERIPNTRCADRIVARLSCRMNFVNVVEVLRILRRPQRSITNRCIWEFSHSKIPNSVVSFFCEEKELNDVRRFPKGWFGDCAQHIMKQREEKAISRVNHLSLIVVPSGSTFITNCSSIWEHIYRSQYQRRHSEYSDEWGQVSQRLGLAPKVDQFLECFRPQFDQNHEV